MGACNCCSDSKYGMKGTATTEEEHQFNSSMLIPQLTNAVIDEDKNTGSPSKAPIP